MKLLLFDIDGTLLLTNGAGTRAANRAFEKIYGIKNAMNRIDAAGKTDPIILKEIFPKKKLKNCINTMSLSSKKKPENQRLQLCRVS